MSTFPTNHGVTSRLLLADRLALARARLERSHGNLWRAAAAYGSGRSAGWLAARLCGRTAFDQQFAKWIETECGIDIVDGAVAGAVINTDAADLSASGNDLTVTTTPAAKKK